MPSRDNVLSRPLRTPGLGRLTCLSRTWYTTVTMPCPSAILNSLSHAEKRSLSGIFAVALPADDLVNGVWNVALLEDILTFLDLGKELAEGLYPITEQARLGQPPSADPRADWKERVDPFRSCLPLQGETRCIVLRDLMVLVALRSGYDARTRVTFRRVCEAMRVPWHPRVSEVESTLARKVYEQVTRERERELRSDRWRNMKIGAAMLGGGALLAVTGGLAAPALAAGITATSSIIGTTAAATLSGFATTTWMATVFGATGAGLVGYKMDRRTQGVKEFEFESETSVGEEMSVTICVPGVLRGKADLQRAWGVEPRGKDVSAKERLRRYYYVYNRDKVGDVEDILRVYDGRESKLCKTLVERYGADPRDALTREALARSEGRSLEGVDQEDVKRDAEAIGHLMEEVLKQEKQEKEKIKVKKKPVVNFLSGTNPPPHVGDNNNTSPPAASTASNKASNAPPSAAAGADSREAAAAAVEIGPVAPPVATLLEEPRHEDEALLRDWDRDSEGQIGDASQGVGSRGARVQGSGGTTRDTAVDQGAASGAQALADDLDGVEGAEGEDVTKDGDDLGKLRVWFWQDKLPHNDQYVLRWESDWLVKLGKSVENIMKSIRSNAIQEALKYTTLAAIMTSIAWPLTLISLADMIDGDWTIGKERADIAGKILADALLNREQGCRPVTLIGTSLGARLIFACLEEIARRHELWEEQMLELVGDDSAGSGLPNRVKNAVKKSKRGRSGSRRSRLLSVSIERGSRSRSRSRSGAGRIGEAKCAAGVIENVCLLGAPVGASSARWERVSRLVHGRVINGYSKSDLILGLVFRAKSLSLSVAGIQKVPAEGVENLDLSSVIGSNHFNYNRKMPEILSLMALDDCSKYVPTANSSGSIALPAVAVASTAKAGDVDTDQIVYGSTVVPQYGNI